MISIKKLCGLPIEMTTSFCFGSTPVVLKLYKGHVIWIKNCEWFNLNSNSRAIGFIIEYQGMKVFIIWSNFVYFFICIRPAGTGSVVVRSFWSVCMFLPRTRNVWFGIFDCIFECVAVFNASVQPGVCLTFFGVNCTSNKIALFLQLILDYSI